MKKKIEPFTSPTTELINLPEKTINQLNGIIQLIGFIVNGLQQGTCKVIDHWCFI